MVWNNRNLELLISRGVKIGYPYVHLQPSLVQVFVLFFQNNFEKVIKILGLKRIGGAPKGHQFCTPTY